MPSALNAHNPAPWVPASPSAHADCSVLSFSSDAHAAEAIGLGSTTFPGRSADELRAAILAGQSGWQGTFHATAGQLGTFGRQLRKYGRDLRDETGGRVRNDGTGRDHGYPGGRQRPPRFDLGPEDESR